MRSCAAPPTAVKKDDRQFGFEFEVNDVAPTSVSHVVATEHRVPRLVDIIEQIRRDTETLNDKEYPNEIWPNAQFYRDRIASFRQWAVEVQRADQEQRPGER